MKSILSSLSHLLGFERLSEYERNYLHESNMQTGIFLGIITILLEIWMLIRQALTNIIPDYQEGGQLFELIVQNTSKYWLFLLFGLGLAFFCLFRTRDKQLTKGRFFTLLATGLACILYTPVAFLESYLEAGDTITPTMAGIVNVLTVSLYVLLFMFGATIVIYALNNHLKNRNIVLLEHLTIGFYSLICLAFGILVSYTDFWKNKEITCFLMMMIYIGVLMLYRPYITILTLGAACVIFYHVLTTFQNGLSFQAKEVLIFGAMRKVTSGDMVNYITFFISLIVICIAMYHGRLREARRTSDLRAATVELERKHSEMHEQFIQTSQALASAIDAKDPYTNGHSVRVADYSKAIAEKAGKSEDACESIYYAALLHDVGKIGVSKAILSKPGRLTDAEFDQIKQHTIMGSQILSNISLIPWLSIGARYHHERYNGRGYPEGLKGEEIPEIGRIIAVADAYDAMTSNRSYRNAIPQHIVREELVKGSGTQFDPEFARIMIHMLDMDTEYRMQETEAGANLSPTTSLRCDSIYHDCTEGVAITQKQTSIRLCSQPDEGFPKEESLPTLIVFDSLDGQIHPGEENNKDLLYFEYARIRLDGQVMEVNTRKAELRTLDRETDLEYASFGEPENSQRYKVAAARYRDHAIIRVSDEKRVFEVILALPDTSRFVYIAIGGEHCYVHNILVGSDGTEIGPNDIPRIAEEISFIKGCPEGDVPNLQVDTWRSDATAGIPVLDGMTLSFHSMSLPTARLVWHCPFISVFSSADGKVSGADFREYMLLRLDGENWESDDHVENKVEVKKTASFEGWNVWKDENKKGLDCVVKIKREGNVITMQTENVGIVIHSITTIHDNVTDVYVALTGDQCVLTDIRVIRDR